MLVSECRLDNSGLAWTKLPCCISSEAPTFGLWTCFHIFQMIWKLGGGGCWAISKKCSIIEENCEGCQRVPGMSLSAGWLQLNERCLSREILCLINEMNQQLWTHLPTISAAEIFFFPRLWTSSCGYVHICAEWYEFNGEWEWARHCWCRKEIVMSGFGQCRESRVSVSDSS